MLVSANIKSAKICAFCQYWYDPANAAIVPQNPVSGFWKYDDQMWNVCKLYGTKRRSGMGCTKHCVKNL